MKLHIDYRFFADTIRATSQHLNIRQEFIEKDYWITLVLSRLSASKYAKETVFKGGTSLSKGFGLIDRFSEDVDLAIINTLNKTGNEIKTTIRSTEKEITDSLTEIQMEGVTSKGSRFRKSVFEYDSIDLKNKSNRLIIEVNSFANSFSYQSLPIQSMIHDFLVQSRNIEYVEQYDLQPFSVNVLNKEQTMVEKLVSLIRFSFDENPVDSLSQKIRHFYDLYFLSIDADCAYFLKSETFNKRFSEILDHDRDLFDVPSGWKDRPISESPLLKDFPSIWDKLQSLYNTELSALAYAPIPDQKLVAHSFTEMIEHLK
ncbi:MAG: nucleotidyl transferase AbiEii/AbiGii toxin family protein [Bacteroidetes bacterium]|nr:MAG: nucleotidyl transferase AbiEii/AbiGii toxin family protein [Bacteroidota bacterium]